MELTINETAVADSINYVRQFHGSDARKLLKSFRLEGSYTASLPLRHNMIYCTMKVIHESEAKFLQLYPIYNTAFTYSNYN
jgi:hypothetical protein